MDDLLKDLDKSLNESREMYRLDDKGFSKGKWYKSPPPYNRYMKFSHIENIYDSKNSSQIRYYRLWYSEEINKKHSIVEDYWSNDGWEEHALNYGPVSKEELSQFLPKDHPDLQ
jgi:hypothetical protein